MYLYENVYIIPSLFFCIDELILLSNLLYSLHVCPLANKNFTPVEILDPRAACVYVRLFSTNQMVRFSTNRKGSCSSNEDRVPVQDSQWLILEANTKRVNTPESARDRHIIL